MLSLFACICFGSIFCGYVSSYAVNDYALYFPNKGVSDYVNIRGMRSLTQFTVCFWMKSSDKKEGTPVSYAVPGRANELLFLGYSNFRLWIGDAERRTHRSANDGRWHHICASWRNIDGAFQFYKDGVLHLHSTGFKKGHIISGGGSLVLGQDQDTIGGRFESKQSFQGYLTNVNVWSYVLSAKTIRSLSKSCLAGVGNVYKWYDFIHGIKGKTAVVIPSPCHPLSSQG